MMDIHLACLVIKLKKDQVYLLNRKIPNSSKQYMSDVKILAFNLSISYLS